MKLVDIDVWKDRIDLAAFIERDPGPLMKLGTARDVLSKYDAEAVCGWLDVLERDETVNSVAALLIHKLRNRETPPRRNNGRPSTECGVCLGTGTYRVKVPEDDPSYGVEFRCHCAQ